MIKVGDNFNYQGQKPNFERDTFKTLLEMKNYPETSIDEGHISLCLEDGKRYKFISTNTVDDTTGKWRRIVDTALDATSENPVQNKVIQAKFTAEEQAFIAQLTAAITQINERIANTKSELQNEITESSGNTDEKIIENEKVVSQAIGELEEALLDLDNAVAGAISDLRRRVVDSSTTINGYELKGNIDLTKNDVGLGRVDNTSDAEKPLSQDAINALGGKVDKVDGKSLISNSLITKISNLPSSDELGEQIDGLSGDISNVANDLSDHANAKNNPHGVTASQIGLESFVGYEPSTLPVSSNIQEELDKKVDKTTKISTHPLSGDITLSPGDVNLGNVDNTSDLNKPLSKPQEKAIDAASLVIVTAIHEIQDELSSMNGAMAKALNELWLENIELKKRITLLEDNL